MSKTETDGYDVEARVRTPSPEAAGPIKDARQTMAENGVDTVVRIVDETSQVVDAFGRRSRDVGYTGETADGVAEAGRVLETR